MLPPGHGVCAISAMPSQHRSKRDHANLITINALIMLPFGPSSTWDVVYNGVVCVPLAFSLHSRCQSMERNLWSTIMAPIHNGMCSLAVHTFLLLSLVNVASCIDSTGYLPYNFTLAAVNVTLPNANLTGAPLVLGQDGMKSLSARVPLINELFIGASSGISFYVTSVLQFLVMTLKVHCSSLNRPTHRFRTTTTHPKDSLTTLYERTHEMQDGSRTPRR